MEIIALPIPAELNPETAEDLFALLSPQERERVARFLQPAVGRRQLVASAFLRLLLSLRLELAPAQLTIERGVYGKPALAAGHNLHFNLSHAGDFVVVALAGREVGVDIELVAARDFEALAAFFSPRELAEFRRQTPAARQDFFYALWTAKESFLKATGRGFALDLASFTIHLAPTIVVESSHDSRSWHFKQYAFAPRYWLTVCSLATDFPATVQIMEFSTLLAWAGGVRAG